MSVKLFQNALLMLYLVSLRWNAFALFLAKLLIITCANLPFQIIALKTRNLIVPLKDVFALKITFNLHKFVNNILNAQLELHSVQALVFAFAQYLVKRLSTINVKSL